MPPPKPIKLDDEALKQFADGRFNSRTESKIAIAIEQSPELQKRLAAISGDGLLDRVREIASQSRAGDEASPSSTPLQASVAPNASTGKRRIKGVPKELAESGDYRILKELGRGGMGVVYLAKYLPMDRPEVLKVLNSQMVKRESARQRFVTEMKAIGKLNHPSIATAYQQVALPTQLVFSMEYVPGIDLHQFIAKYQPLPIPAACEIASQIAGALQHAHKRKMVHRDIKPSNVMVFKEDDRRQIKILDFGLAKATSEQESAGLTADGTMLGTPEYMAPEQAIDAATADIRADIYSLGCTLYHMLTGHPPFTGTYQSVLMSHATKEADYISFERTDVPVELSEIVAKMMGKEPDKRYQTPNEAAAALKPFCGTSQVTKTAKPSVAKFDTRIDLGSPSRDTSIEGPCDLPANPTPGESIPEPVPAPHIPSTPAVSVEESLANLKVQPRTTRKPSQTKSRKRESNQRRRKTPNVVLIAGGLLAALLVWASVVMLKTDKGTLVIENIPENAKVLIDGEQVEVTIDEKTMTAKTVLSAREHQVEVSVDGSILQGKNVTISAKSDNRIIFRNTSAGGQASETSPVSITSVIGRWVGKWGPGKQQWELDIRGDGSVEYLGAKRSVTIHRDRLMVLGEPIHQQLELKPSGDALIVRGWTTNWKGKRLDPFKDAPDVTTRFNRSAATMSLEDISVSGSFLGRSQIVVPAKSSGVTLGDLRKGQIISLSYVAGEWGYGGSMGHRMVSPESCFASGPLSLQLIDPKRRKVFLPNHTKDHPFVYRVTEDGQHTLSIGDSKKEDNIGEASYEVVIHPSEHEFLGGEFSALSANLVRNPGCELFGETGNIQEWQLVAGEIKAKTAIYRRKIRSGMASFGCGSVKLSMLSQTIDLIGQAKRIDDGGLFVNVTGFLNTYAQPIEDRGSIRLVALDAKQALIGTYDSGYRTTKNRWSLIDRVLELPRNTRFVEIQLVGLRPAYTDCNVAFDDISIVLGEVVDLNSKQAGSSLQLKTAPIPVLSYRLDNASELEQSFVEPVHSNRMVDSEVSGRCLRFTGGTDALTTRVPAGVKGSEPRTVSVWVRPTKPFGKDNRVIFRWGDETTDGSKFALLMSGSEVMVHGRNQDKKLSCDSLVDRWTHLAVIYEGAKIYIEVNGKRSTGSLVQLNTSDTPITFSDSGSVGFYSPWQGEIDEFEVFDRVLNDVELRHLRVKHQINELPAKAAEARKQLDRFIAEIEQSSTDSVQLFNGKDLTGWIGADNSWTVVNEELVCVARSKQAAPFASLQEIPGNFELRFEVLGRVDNGGVNYRSSLPDDKHCEVGPLQFEIGGKWGLTGDVYNGQNKSLVATIGQTVTLGRGGIIEKSALPNAMNTKSTASPPLRWTGCRIVSTETGIRHYVDEVLVGEVLDPYRTLPRFPVIAFESFKSENNEPLSIRNILLRANSDVK